MQRMFFFDNEIDISMIYFVRRVTKNFIVKHKEESLNGYPLGDSPKFEGFEKRDIDTLDGYFKNILMKMYEDAQGFLLVVIPIIMRVNVYIVTFNES
jgi:hypothetical protein